MAYEAEKDQILESWENSETGLTVSIYRYAGGDPKLQIGPRSYTKKDGSKGSTRTGRLSIDDVLWLSEILDEVREKMNGHFMES